jgi:hypothetical protein
VQPVDTAILVMLVLGGVVGLGGITHLFSPCPTYFLADDHEPGYSCRRSKAAPRTRKQR